MLVCMVYFSYFWILKNQRFFNFNRTSFNLQRVLKFRSREPLYPYNSFSFLENVFVTTYWNKLIILHRDMECILQTIFLTQKVTTSDNPILFYLFFVCPTPKLGPLLREQPHSTDVNHCIFTIFWLEGHLESCSKAGSLNSTDSLVWFEPGRLWFDQDALTH